MRKAWIGVLTGAMFFAVVGVALALTTNSVQYSASMTYKGKATKKKPKSITYRGILKVGTTDGKQPNTASKAEVFLARQIRTNAKRFKSCKRSDIDGKASIPNKCKAAKVGGGTASASLGAPGQDSQATQPLTVGAYNGHGGKQIMLVVSGGPVTNRVIPGFLRRAKAPFGLKIVFTVPRELQGQLGTQIALTDFDVLIDDKRKVKVKVGKKKKGKKQKTQNVTYLQLTKCPSNGELPVKAIVHFNNDDNSPGGQVEEHESTMSCS